jgi:hypothetical protein
MICMRLSLYGEVSRWQMELHIINAEWTVDSWTLRSKSAPVLLFLCEFCLKSLPALLPRIPRAGWLLLFAITAPQQYFSGK